MRPKNPPRRGGDADGLWTAEVHISRVNQADFALSSRLWSRGRVGTNKFPREHNKTGVEVARRLTVKLFPGETAGKKRKAIHSRPLKRFLVCQHDPKLRVSSFYFYLLLVVRCCCAAPG